LPENLTLYEGQRLTSIATGERRGFNFANILGAILEDFILRVYGPSLWISFNAKFNQRFVELSGLC
jgi:hypothetical protein